MPKTTEYRYTIRDPNAPERLRGRTLIAVLVEGPTKGAFEFSIDMPDDPTKQEIGYVEWFIGETVEAVTKGTGIEASKRASVLIPDPPEPEGG